MSLRKKSIFPTSTDSVMEVKSKLNLNNKLGHKTLLKFPRRTYLFKITEKLKREMQLKFRPNNANYFFHGF